MWGLYNSPKNFSILFPYYILRTRSGREGQLVGGTLREALKTVFKYGLEDHLNYPDIDANKQPSYHNMINADNHRIKAYFRVDSFNDVMDNLSKGRPIYIGTSTQFFADAIVNGKSKDVLEIKSKQSWTTGHAMVIVGFIPDFEYHGEKRNVFIVRNTWGTAWGDKGYCYLPAKAFWDYLVRDAWSFICTGEDLDAPSRHQETIEEVEIYFQVGNKNMYVWDGKTMQTIEMDTEPIILNGRIYVPIRFSAYGFGVVEENIEWNQQMNLAKIKAKIVA